MVAADLDMTIGHGARDPVTPCPAAFDLGVCRPAATIGG